MLSTASTSRLKRGLSLVRFAKINLSRPRKSSTLRENDEPQVDNGEEPLVITEKFETLTLIGLNRPSKRNALNKSLISSLDQALIDYENDDNARVAVLYGIGGSFCAGLDLEEIATSDKFERPVLPLVDRLCKKVIVASISGYAVAEGLDLALACDMRIIESTAIVGVLSRRFGLPLTETSIRRIVACAGFSRAMNFILTNQLIRASEAVSLGFATELTPCGAARGTAITTARSLVKFSAASLLADRAAMYKYYGATESIRQMAEKEAEIYLQSALKLSNYQVDTVYTFIRLVGEYQPVYSGSLTKECRTILLNEDIPRSVARFKEGIGKHGSFHNLTDYGKTDWIPK